MAKQNVGTPRFYIDNGLYQSQTGLWTPEADQLSLVQLNPANIVDRPTNYIDVPRISPLRYIAFLGHSGGSYYPSFQEELGIEGFQEIVNMTGYDEIDEAFSGFSIGTFTDMPNAITLRAVIGTEGSTLGAVSIGNYFDIPHSPELSLTMSHEYDGVKKQATAGGSTLSYVNYHKPPDWGGLQAWQLEGWDRKYSGRRVWDLAFNHLSDSDIEPYHYNIDSSSGHDSWNDDGNFFTNVLHYTNGGQLPFIFCPDPSIVYYASTWTIPEFTICRFDMKTFKREQVANGIYNIKVKIKESW